MKHYHRFFLLAIFILLSQMTISQSFKISSPSKNIELRLWMSEGHAFYSVAFKSEAVIKDSRLGLETDPETYAGLWQLINASAVSRVTDHYELYAGKKSVVNYTANHATVHFKNSYGKKMDIIFQLSDDGVAFRYFFPQKDNALITITSEYTSYHFDTLTKAFLQPMQVAKSGWEKTNPAYEEHYLQNISVREPSPSEAGWVYPALFRSGNNWVLITEAAVDSNFCATRLAPITYDTPGNYKIAFPDSREIKTGGQMLPRGVAPFYSPWRVITIGSLKTIIESTLGTDVAKPAIKMQKAFIKPGKASWSWIMSKDDSIVYSEQVRYVDFAAKMNWQYCLIDADWDRKIGYEKIAELSKYAASKNVALLLWYNSAGDWNTVKYTPKGKLLTHEDRVKEFTRLKEMGIKGVKIDFFGGDGQSVMKYYHEILIDAAHFELLVNFHGATLPRGWYRTYPNLLTTEAVRGFEMITFTQPDADAEANHCAMLPFTRNAFDPMDFTPMNLYKIPTKVQRKTSSGFELATAVLFYSGIQHFAESPDGMSHVPGYVQDFLRQIPTRWDDVKFIDGYPGKFVVLARRSGNTWYVAGINAESTEKMITINLKDFKKQNAQYIGDGETPLSFRTEKVPGGLNKPMQITIQPLGGFVMVLK